MPAYCPLSVELLHFPLHASIMEYPPTKRQRLMTSVQRRDTSVPSDVPDSDNVPPLLDHGRSHHLNGGHVHLHASHYKAHAQYPEPDFALEIPLHHEQDLSERSYIDQSTETTTSLDARSAPSANLLTLGTASTPVSDTQAQEPSTTDSFLQEGPDGKTPVIVTVLSENPRTTLRPVVTHSVPSLGVLVAATNARPIALSSLLPQILSDIRTGTNAPILLAPTAAVNNTASSYTLLSSTITTRSSSISRSGAPSVYAASVRTASPVSTPSQLPAETPSTSSPNPTFTPPTASSHFNPIAFSSNTLTSSFVTSSPTTFMTTSSIPTSTSSTSETGGMGGAEASGSSSGANTTAAPLTQNGNTGSGLPTPQIVGGVVGGVAGLSILLIIALLILRWVKQRRKARAHALSIGVGHENDSPSRIPNRGPVLPEMSQAPGFTTSGVSADTAAAVVVGAAAAGTAAKGGTMRRLSRPKSMQPPPATSERGFERLSGRKLPSQFSPGMEGPTHSPANAGTVAFYPSGSSVYPSGIPAGAVRYPSGGTFLSSSPPSSDDPFVDPILTQPHPAARTSPFGIGTAMTSNQPAVASTTEERVMPGPGRTATVQISGQNRTSQHLATLMAEDSSLDSGRATPSPPLRHRPTLGRSHISQDGSRNSRFTEDLV